MNRVLVTTPAAYLYEQPHAGLYSQAVFGEAFVAEPGTQTTSTDATPDGHWVQRDAARHWIDAADAMALDRLPAQSPWRDRPALPHDDREPRRGWRVVTALEAHVFDRPSMKAAPPVLRLPYGVWLPLADPPEHHAHDDPDRRDRFATVVLPDGHDNLGYIRIGDLSDALPALDHDDLPMLATRFLGRPYTWGGNSSFGFDCSGLVICLARHRGHHLPHQTRTQYRADGLPLTRIAQRPPAQRGGPIETDPLTPGDLLYFSRDGEPSGIYHVGVYAGGGDHRDSDDTSPTDGHGLFLHASARNTPSVQWGRLDDPTYREHFIGAVRVQ